MVENTASQMHMILLQELLQLEDRLGNVNRGAVQTTIERFTFPHKYKKVSLTELYLYILISKQKQCFVVL